MKHNKLAAVLNFNVLKPTYDFTGVFLVSLVISCNMCLLIRPNSFLAGLSTRTLELFWKFGLWYFKVIKVLLLQLISIRLTTTSLALKIFFPSLTITLWTLLFSFFVKVTAQKMKFSIKDFFSKCDQIPGKLRRCSFGCSGVSDCIAH